MVLGNPQSLRDSTCWTGLPCIVVVRLAAVYVWRVRRRYCLWRCLYSGSEHLRLLAPDHWLSGTVLLFVSKMGCAAGCLRVPCWLYSRVIMSFFIIQYVFRFYFARMARTISRQFHKDLSGQEGWGSSTFFCIQFDSHAFVGSHVLSLQLFSHLLWLFESALFLLSFYHSFSFFILLVSFACHSAFNVKRSHL